jgi:hypothetical protein
VDFPGGRTDRTGFVDRVAQHVHDAAQRADADRHRDGAPVLSASRLRFRPSVEPSAMVRTTPSPSCCCTSSVIAVFCTFSASYTFGTLAREFDVDDGADDLDDLALVAWCIPLNLSECFCGRGLGRSRRNWV